MTTANDLTVHAMTVGAFVPLLRQLEKMLEKAEAFAVAKKLDAGVIEGLRLAPDMFTLTRQVQLTCDFAKNSAYRLAAIDPPKMPDDEQSLADLRGRVDALDWNRRLWSALGSDCAADGNGLPDGLRASIISLSIWVGKHTSAVIRREEEIEPLIEVNRMVMQGLGGEAG